MPIKNWPYLSHRSSHLKNFYAILFLTKDHVTRKWMPGASTTKTESAEKKMVGSIASYIASSLTYNKTFYIFIKSMKRFFHVSE